LHIDRNLQGLAEAGNSSAATAKQRYSHAFLGVAVERAEYWDASTSRMVRIAGFVKAVFGGSRAQPAEHGKVEGPEKEAATDQPRERE
jgi:hypothetical protein